MFRIVTLPGLELNNSSSFRREEGFRELFSDISIFFGRKMPPLLRENEVSSEISEAVNFLKLQCRPFDVINFARWAVLLMFFISLIIFVLCIVANVASFSLLLFLFSLPFLLYYVIVNYVRSEARFEKIEEIGNAPGLLTQLIIFLKQNPNMERALLMVSKFSSGKIASDMKDMLWQSLMGHRSNIRSEIGGLAQKWGKVLEEIGRSFYLIVAAIGERNEIKRNYSLDRAIRIALDGIVTKLGEYTNKLYLPTLFLFSFGTILPLVIISLLPIFSFFGNEFNSPIQIFFLLSISLTVIYIYSNSIIAQRPPSFSKISLPSNMPGYPARGNMKFSIFGKEIEFNAIFYIVGILTVISLPGILYLVGRIPGVTMLGGVIGDYIMKVNTLTIVWAVGISISVYCYGTSWYKKKMRDSVEALENELVDGLYSLASRIGEGRSPENAMEIVSKSMPGSGFGEVLKESYGLIKSRQMTIGDAFFDREHGVLRKCYSGRFNMTMQLFSESLSRGADYCSQTLFMMSEHLERLKKTENKLREMLRNSISMMKVTASIFAPMITGLVITLQQLIQNGIAESQVRFETMEAELFNLSFLKAPGFSIEILQLVSGVYMICLAVLLIRYVVLLEHGKDEVMMKIELARNIPIALFIFTFTLVLSRVLMI